jgi:hypothetical protein
MMTPSAVVCAQGLYGLDADEGSGRPSAYEKAAASPYELTPNLPQLRSVPRASIDQYERNNRREAIRSAAKARVTRNFAGHLVFRLGPALFAAVAVTFSLIGVNAAGSLNVAVAFTSFLIALSSAMASYSIALVYSKMKAAWEQKLSEHRLGS